MRIREIGLAAFLVGLSAATASADWLISPSAGLMYDDTLFDRDDQNATFGVAVGAMGAGVLGFEIDLGFTPDYLDALNANLTSLMANAMVGFARGDQIRRFHVYGSGGVGLIRLAGGSGASQFTNNNVGANIGGGIIGLLTEHVGLRGDLRYFRDLHEEELDPRRPFNVGELNFWRVTGGATFRF